MYSYRLINRVLQMRYGNNVKTWDIPSGTLHEGANLDKDKSGREEMMSS